MHQQVIPDLIVSAARQYLASRRRRCLSVSDCQSLAAQIKAVDVGLKPALLYDLNSAEPRQIQLYLRCLQGAGHVSKALHLLVMDGSVIIVNLDLCILHLEELLQDNTVAFMDVSRGNIKPAVADVSSVGVGVAVQGVLGRLKALTSSSESEAPLVSLVGPELCASWNLCSLFGILLGYPAVYWFDLTHDAENCLSMVPLRVTRVTACWEAVAGGDRCCLYSFSIPEELLSETQGTVETWDHRLRTRFSHQSAFSKLTVCTETLMTMKIKFTNGHQEERPLLDNKT